MEGPVLVAEDGFFYNQEERATSPTPLLIWVVPKLLDSTLKYKKWEVEVILFQTSFS